MTEFFHSLFTRVKVNSIKFKISILYTAVLGIILMMFSAMLYVIFAQHLSRLLEGQLTQEAALRGLSQAMIIGIPIVLLLTSFVGLIFVRRILDPIEDIARTAKQITYKDLSTRVKTKHLDSEIDYLVASFNDMIDRLEKAFEHINEFSSHIAHELKTPLAIIRGETELALSQERDKEEYKKILRSNLEESSRMRRTIEDLLLLARLDYQPELFKFQAFDFTEFFSDICEQAKMLAADKGLSVESVVPTETIMINGDKLHLRRMLFNIIDNALKFTPSPGEIRIHAGYEHKKLLILISDTGVGILPKDMPHIFEKFYYADYTGKSKGSNTGLGLSIARGILKIHHGHIHATSKPGESATFHIMLPV